jgi:hypothetical protein
MEPTDSNNYLYYVISDDEGKVRGHIIGAQHWVEEKDKDLNPLIIQAIDRSARIILEQPPGSDLLPKEPQYFHDTINYIMEDLNLNSSESKSSEDYTSETTKIQSRLKHIQEQIVEIKGGYEKLEDIVHHLQSDKDKLKFLNEIEKMISQSKFDIKLVSLESNINRIIQEKENLEEQKKLV